MADDPAVAALARAGNIEGAEGLQRALTDPGSLVPRAGVHGPAGDALIRLWKARRELVNRPIRVLHEPMRTDLGDPSPLSVIPPPSSIANPLDQLGVWRVLIPAWVELLRRHPGMAPTSWWRSPGRNRDVGGAPRSQHLLGLAMDFAAPRQVLVAAAEDARAIGWEVLLEESPLHLHTQAMPARSIPEAVFRYFGL